MTKRTISILLIVIFVIYSTNLPIHGNNLKGEELLKKGMDYYENAFYEKAINALENALNFDLNKSGKIKANLGIALSYIILDKKENSKVFFKEIIKIDPDYQIDKTQYPPDVVEFFNEVKENKNSIKPEIITENKVAKSNENKEEIIIDEPPKTENSNVIEVIGKKKKKKFPVLLALAGVTAIVAAVVLLGGNKKESNPTPTPSRLAQEVYDSIQWVSVPGGNFQMGNNFNNEGAPNEKPVHTVYLDSYYMSKYEVTFDQYDKFCDDTGRTKPRDEGWGRGNRPVINVWWDNAKAFCDWLTSETGTTVSLPTEAQWEKAARGTDQRRYPWGNSNPNSNLCNYKKNVGKTQPVGSYPSGVSPYGIHDMAGNVWEWCSDWYSSNYYSSSPTNNPTGPSSGAEKVMRGGCWNSSHATYVRSANRDSYYADYGSYKEYYNGFRISKN